MGLYINPESKTKEQWLDDNSIECVAGPIPTVKMFEGVSGHTVVCLVDNGDFTAAGVAYDAEELRRFTYPCGRPKIWYLIPNENLDKVTNGDFTRYCDSAERAARNAVQR